MVTSFIMVVIGGRGAPGKGNYSPMHVHVLLFSSPFPSLEYLLHSLIV